MLREHAMYTHHCFVLACCLGAALPAPPATLRPRRTERPGAFPVARALRAAGADRQLRGDHEQHLAERQRPGPRRTRRPAGAAEPGAPGPQRHPGRSARRRPATRRRQRPGPRRRRTGADPGVSQSIRTAGDHNSASNGVSIEVRHGEAPPPLPGGTPLEGALALSGETGTVKVTPNGGALQLAIQASGQGASLQSLGAGGLVQSVALSGNRNLVQNLAALEVMLKDRPGADPALNCAWEHLRAPAPAATES